MKYNKIWACLGLIFIQLILNFYTPSKATDYNIDHFSGVPTISALINRGSDAFVSGDSLSIQNNITATSAIGNIGTTSTFVLTITGNGNTINGNSTYSGFSMPALSNYSFNTTNLNLFRTTSSTVGAAITSAGILSFTDGNFTGNSAVNGGAIRNTGTETITGTITMAGAKLSPTDTSTTNFTNNTSVSGFGGAIYTTGTSNITGVKFDGNDANGTGTSAGGGAIYTSTATATIDNDIFVSNTAQRSGGAIYQASGTLNITSSLFDSNTATNIVTSAGLGGSIYSALGSIVNITNTEFSNNSCKTTGGAIWSRATLDINQGTFTGNSSNNMAGALYSGGTCTIRNSVFENNSAHTSLANAGGGAIYNNSSAMTITDTTFKTNSTNILSATSANGGAIYNTGTAASLTITGTISGSGLGALSTTTFSNNTAQTNGGSIYNNSINASTSLNSTGVIFDTNSASNGGAVYNAAGIGSFSNNIFKNNSSTTSGGAFYNIGTTTITGSDFLSNSATVSGGAFYNTGSATFLNCDFSGNTAGTNGGAIFNSGTLRIQADAQESLFTGNLVGGVANDLHLAGGTVYLNAGNGGSITFDGAITSSAKANIISINSTTGSSTLTNGTINFNNDISTATINISSGTTNIGKNIIANVNENNVLFAVTGGVQNFTNNTFLNGSRITLNDATPTVSESLNVVNGNFTGSGSFTGSGGAINVTRGTSDITESDFSGYTATTSGGAIYNDGTAANTKMTLTNDNFTNNTSVNGGGIYNTGAMEITGTITGTGASATSTTTFLTNRATTGSGGAIYNSGTLTLNEVKFDGNSSTSTSTTGGGGAIYQGGVLHINKGIFVNNNTTARGGAIFGTSGATGSIGSGSIFESNSATGTSSSGGAIYTLGSPTIDGVTFNKNYSTINGGAMYIAGSTVTMLNDIFTDNGKNGAVAETDNGGAIYNDVGNITITDTTFTNNASTLTGGAIRNAVSSTNSITLNGATFTGNSSANGGAIYNEGIMHINSGSDVTKFTGNSATLNGGAIYGLGGAGSVSSGTLFDSNTAGQDGGAIYTTSTPSFSGAIFQNNWAERNGGAVYSATTNTSYTNCTFTGNGKNGAIVRTDNGGAIYDANSAMVITGGTFTSNASSAAGGAIYNTITTTGRTFSTNGTTFTLNSSLNGGAFYNNSGVANLTDTNFTTNSASNNGGAIFSTGGTMTITGNEFTSNSAVNFGGAIYNNAGTTTNIANSNFSLSTALSGGAVYNIGGTLTLTDCSFSNNSATTSGGAIYIASGTVNVNATGENVTFSSNTQGGIGNDIYMADSAILNLNSNGYDITLNGGIQGIGTINKAGSDDLILNSTTINNLFTGRYNNNAGNVQIKSAFFTGVNYFTAGTADIQSGGSLTLNSGDSWTNSVISNSGGTLNFDGFSHTSGGAYNQSSGILSLNNTGTASSFTLTSGSSFTGGNINFTGIGNTLSVGAGGVFSSAPILNLTTGNNFTVSGGDATLSNTDTWAGTVNISSGTLNLNSITSHGIYNQTGGVTNLSSDSILTISNASDNLSGGTFVDNGVLNLSNATTKTFATSISGPGVINKNAAGATTFTGNNSGFTGTYNQTLGAVTIQNAFFSGVNNFNGGTVSIGINGNLVLNTGDTWTTTNISTAGGSLTLDNFSHLTGGTYNQTSGNLHLNNGSYLALNASNTISGGIVDYSGSGSTLDVTTGGAFNTGATLQLTLATENIFKVSGGNATLNSTDIWGGLGKVDLTSGNLTLNGITSNGVYTQSGGALTLSDASGIDSILTLGTGSSISTGSVGFIGAGNRLDVSSNSIFASAATLNLIASNTFRVSGGGAALTNADTWAGAIDVTAGTLTLNSITSNGIYTQSGGTTTLASGTLTFANTSELQGGSLINNGTINLANTGAETVATIISGAGTINKNAIGVSTFTADNSGYTGAYNQTSGGIIIQNDFFTGVNNFTGASTTAEVQTGGSLVLNSGDSWTNTNITSSGGSLTLDGFSHTSGGTYNQTSGALHLNNASSLTLSTSNAISDGTVDFTSTGNLLNIATGGSFGADTSLSISSGNTFRVSGGSAALGNDDTWDGVINLTDGTLTVNNVPHSSGVKGTYSQSGGISNFINQNLDTSSDITISGGTMNINAGNGLSSYINSKISATAGIINFNKTLGSSPTDGIIYLNKWIDPPSEVNLYNGTLVLSGDSYLDGNNLGLYGGVLNTQNSAAGTIALNNLTFGGTSNWLIDVDLANLLADKITSTNPATGIGALNISGINLLSDAGPNLTSVVVADTNSKSYITNSVSSVNGALFTYGVAYDGSGSNGVLNFTKTGISPNAMTGDVAQTSTFLLQTAIDRQFFGNIDSFMSFPLAQRESTICCALSNGYTTGAACPISGNGMFSPIYMCNLNRGIWAKNFVSFENIPLNNGPNVSTIEYGTLIGGDAPITKLRHGFVGNTSAYIGYLGSNQNYNQVGVSQNGGLIGLAENLVKGNLFLTGMASVGYSVGNANTPWGMDSFSSLFAGLAAKGGYNFEFKNGDYIIQPNLMFAYTFTHTPPYRTSSGLDMNTKPLNALQVAPGVRLIKNLKEQKGQVYLIANYVQNIMDNTSFSANDIELPQLSIAPYFEYGIGYQGVWKDRFTGFFQTLFRGGGRNGVAFQFGLRWAF